ncbi:uncharacterized protein IL334_003634 [Kwoniella shivajii]|uniref:Major facilitator superfamily (MFS) profile domain-containing protein n=1 Tax=Kwoniella shivajii TaxID=564305 RepID=A0ABZ1CZB7_9TREE|nr:hypothetical protein IL334_003634 [Kwoniella shivajii]
MSLSSTSTISVDQPRPSSPHPSGPSTSTSPKTSLRSSMPGASPPIPTIPRSDSNGEASTDEQVYVESHFSYPGKGTLAEPYLVDFGPDDKTNPYNWNKTYRWWLTMLIGVTALCPPFASVSYSSTIISILPVFGMSRELSTAGISLFILGTSLGPLIWAPISEIWGRNFAFNISFPVFALFNLGTALSHDTVTLLVMRFFAGFFGSSTLTNAGGQVGDMWAAHERAMATSVFSLAPFLGPVLGGYVTERCGYRWVYWIQFIYAIAVTVATIAILPESYAPTILRRKAARLSKISKEEGKDLMYIAKYDENKKTKAEIIKIGLWRPFELLFTEVIVGCFAIYGAIVYGILYLFFACFPLIYQEVRGWSVGQGGLAFLGMGFGLVLANFLNPLGNYWYKKATVPGRPTPPESRLPLACIAAILLPIGLFWFAWTSAPPVHWIWSILACIPFGLGFLWIFTGMVNYIIDSYTLYAASALAALAVLRCLFGAAFPLFAVLMYRNLGLHIAGTIVAILATACAPLPFLFYRYGPYLRRKSRYAPSQPHTPDEEAMETPAQIEEEKQDELRKVKTRTEDALEPEWASDAGEYAKQGGQGVKDLDLNLGRPLEQKII